VREDLIPGVDYHIENGYWVFTAEYLAKRGYCCESGCKNCPYGYQKKKAELEAKRKAMISTGKYVFKSKIFKKDDSNP
jgi:hypothetical protein